MHRKGKRRIPHRTLSPSAPTGTQEGEQQPRGWRGSKRSHLRAGTARPCDGQLGTRCRQHGLVNGLSDSLGRGHVTKLSSLVKL